jgi:superfamily II DNA helicase RecQ
MSELKKCTKCGDEKPATLEFYGAQKDCKNGLKPHCKACLSKAGKLYHNLHSERILNQKKKWQQNNPEKTKNFIRKWKQKNTDKLRSYDKKNSEQLTDSRVRLRLGLRKDQCPPELIEVKRLQIKIKRLCKTSKT